MVPHPAWGRKSTTARLSIFNASAALPDLKLHRASFPAKVKDSALLP